MEDKELQELFAAKRTTEANRRRQAELARMVGASASPRRRLWPLWATSAAAGIAVLLMTMPSLFNSDDIEPIMVAQVPELEIVEEPIATPEVETTPAIPARRSTRNNQINQINQITQITPTTPSIPASPAIGEPLPQAEPIVAEPAMVEPTSAPAVPRVHRRKSNRIVKPSDTKSIKPVRSNIGQMLADALGSDESNVLTVKTIELS